MPYAQDEAGQWWEVDAAGNVIGPAGGAAPAQRGRVFDLPRSAKDARAEATQAAKDARAERREDRADATASVGNQLKAAELELKRLEIERDGVTAQKQAEWRGNLNNIAGLEKTVADLRQQYDDHFKGKGLFKSAGEAWAPKYFAPEYGVFDVTAQSMLADMAKAKGLTAQQFNTPAEQRMFFEPMIPARGDTDEEIEKKLTALENMIATGRLTTEQNLGAHQHATPETDPAKLAATGPYTNPNDPPPDNSPPGLEPANTPGGNQPTPAPETVANGKYRWVNDPRTAAAINALINAGAGESTINAALKARNYPPMPLGGFGKIRDWMRKNPGQRYNAGARFQEPLSVLEKAAGSTAGAAAANWADAATAGVSTALAGDRGRGALDAMNATHPDASAAGSVLGGVTGAGAAELAIAARAPAALARYAPRIADTLYGGLSGFTGAHDGEGGMGAIKGAGAGLAGGFLGERAVRAAAAATRGVRDPMVQRLRELEIPMTVGQAVGNSGMIGAGIKKVEDAATSIPFVGNMIEARRREGLEAFNRAAFDAAADGAGDQITDTGAEGLDQLRQAIGNSYRRALDPVTIDANDPNLINDLGMTIRAANAIPNVNSAQDAAMLGLQSRITGAVDPETETISGRGFQEAYRGLARTGRERANSDYGHEVGQVMRQGQDALADALERQNPGAFDQFLAANAMNRRANVLADALKGGAANSGEIFTPAQLNRADINSTNKLQGKIAAAGLDRPFYELATAGKSVLPSKVPDSGTWTRTVTGLGLTGALGGGGYVAGGEGGFAAGTGTGLGATLALALGGTQGVQRAATAALLDRPDVAIRIGEELRRRAALGGAAGGGILAQIVAGQ